MLFTAFGFGKEVKEYLDAIERADNDVANIIKAMNERSQWNEDWLVILTTDHGGSIDPRPKAKELGIHGLNIPGNNLFNSFVLIYELYKIILCD
jgi:arylsulfatase A-like enzyme